MDIYNHTGRHLGCHQWLYPIYPMHPWWMSWTVIPQQPLASYCLLSSSSLLATFTIMSGFMKAHWMEVVSLSHLLYASMVADMDDDSKATIGEPVTFFCICSLCLCQSAQPLAYICPVCFSLKTIRYCRASILLFSKFLSISWFNYLSSVKLFKLWEYNRFHCFSRNLETLFYLSGQVRVPLMFVVTWFYYDFHVFAHMIHILFWSVILTKLHELQNFEMLLLHGKALIQNIWA